MAAREEGDAAEEGVKRREWKGSYSNRIPGSHRSTHSKNTQLHLLQRSSL